MMGEDERQELGRRGEDLAAAYLEERGWRIRERNVRWGDGELDIVASREEEWGDDRCERVIFVEVKTRRREGRVRAEANITAKKRQQIARLAQLWAKRNGATRSLLRLDVIAVCVGVEPVQIRHIEGAFDGEGRV